MKTLYLRQSNIICKLRVRNSQFFFYSEPVFAPFQLSEYSVLISESIHDAGIDLSILFSIIIWLYQFFNCIVCLLFRWHPSQSRFNLNYILISLLICYTVLYLFKTISYYWGMDDLFYQNTIYDWCLFLCTQIAIKFTFVACISNVETFACWKCMNFSLCWSRSLNLYIWKNQVPCMQRS